MGKKENLNVSVFTLDQLIAIKEQTELKHQQDSRNQQYQQDTLSATAISTEQTCALSTKFNLIADSSTTQNCIVSTQVNLNTNMNNLCSAISHHNTSIQSSNSNSTLKLPASLEASPLPVSNLTCFKNDNNNNNFGFKENKLNVSDKLTHLENKSKSYFNDIENNYKEQR